MKKILYLILAMALFTFVTGCSDQDDSSSQSNSSNNSSSQSYSSNSKSSSNVSSTSNSKGNKTSKPSSSTKTNPHNNATSKPPVSPSKEPSEPTVIPSEKPQEVPPETSETTPPEEPEKQANGTLYASNMYNLDNYTNIHSIDADKEVDEYAAKFALYTDGMIKNFTIIKVSMDFDTLEYKDEKQLFNLDTFDTDSVVVVRAFFDDTASNLKVTYTTDAGTVIRYLYQSGQDGSILLLEK